MKRALIYGSMVLMTSVTPAQIQLSDEDGDGVSWTLGLLHADGAEGDPVGAAERVLAGG